MSYRIAKCSPLVSFARCFLIFISFLLFCGVNAHLSIHMYIVQCTSIDRWTLSPRLHICYIMMNRRHLRWLWFKAQRLFPYIFEWLSNSFRFNIKLTVTVFERRKEEKIKFFSVRCRKILQIPIWKKRIEYIKKEIWPNWKIWLFLRWNDLSTRFIAAHRKCFPHWCSRHRLIYTYTRVIVVTETLIIQLKFTSHTYTFVNRSLHKFTSISFWRKCAKTEKSTSTITITARTQSHFSLNCRGLDGIEWK